MAFGDPPPCDHCHKPSIVRILTIVFDEPSPPDQYLCRVHAPPLSVVSPDQQGPTKG